MTTINTDLLQIALGTPLHAVLLSHGKKTAGLTLFYGGLLTCPILCPFKNAGCYGESYHCKRQWVNSNILAKDLLQWLIENNYCISDYVRFNEAGDFAIPDTSKINFEYLKLVVLAFEKVHKKGYTYTHCPPNDPDNIKAVQFALAHGFKISFSCEKIADVKLALAAGCPAVLTVNTMSQKHIVIDGINLVSCPSNNNPDTLCRKCQMCFHKYNNTSYVPVFALHGTQASKNKAISKSFLSDI